MKKLIIFLAFIVLFVACDKSEDSTVNPGAEDEILTSDQHAALVTDEIVEANTKFAFTTFKKISELDTAQNSCYSPISLSLALQMLYNGAANETAAELATALNLKELNLEELNQQNLHLVKSLVGIDASTEVGVFNSLWADNTQLTVLESFIEKMTKYYNSDVFVTQGLNKDEINNWVSDKTKGLIEGMVTDEDMEALVLAIFNAIYFKGNWTFAFDPEQTQIGSFCLSNPVDEASFRIAEFMKSEGKDFTYYFGEEFNVARLPYGDQKLAMYILLPGKDDYSLDNLFENLDYETWNNCLNNLEKIEEDDPNFPNFYFKMPKMKIKNSFEFKEMLEMLGLHQIFSRPDLANLVVENSAICFKDIKQASFIEVNEAGTEAAAASESPGSNSISCFSASKPFVYLIQDDRSKSILFMGKVTNPSGFVK